MGVIWGIILRDFWGDILRGAPMRTSVVSAFRTPAFAIALDQKVAPAWICAHRKFFIDAN
jgi:hypothetical protein